MEKMIMIKCAFKAKALTSRAETCNNLKSILEKNLRVRIDTSTSQLSYKLVCKLKEPIFQEDFDNVFKMMFGPKYWRNRNHYFDFEIFEIIPKDTSSIMEETEILNAPYNYVIMVYTPVGGQPR